MLVGVSQVAGNLLLSVTDTLWGRSPGGQRYQETVDYDQAPDHRRSERWETRSRVRGQELSSEISHAVREIADVVSRSAENFSRNFDAEAERDWAEDEMEVNDSGSEPLVRESAESGAARARHPRKP